MTTRSKVIEKSLGCLDFGFASLIPVAGLLFAMVALARFRFAVVETNDRWNPARVHLYGGAALAMLSLLAHAVVGVVIYLKALRAAGDI
jgi:hypothetical protein